MNGVELKTCLRSGKKIFGTLLISQSPAWPKAVAGMGLDYVFLCTEHHALNRETLSWMCRTYKAMNIAPLVRIPSPDPYAATVALDDGATGVIAPYVETPEEVRALVGALKYRPLKGERLKSVLAGKETLGPKMVEYIREFNKNNVLVINVESKPAVENIDALLSIPELDGILIGPHDLSCSYEMPEEYANPAFVAIIDGIIEKTRAKGKGFGYHKGYVGPGIEQEIEWAKKGMNMILHEGDILSFSYHMNRDLNTIRDALGESKENGGAVTV
ncbi:MAG TPA: aldolase/citrate lyase family protein [Spirochaetia bacterium]|nr:aldolase/citrate lyase family protein [Spirochaetia bacterium]